MVGPRKIFRLEVLRWMENAILNLVLSRIYRKCVRHSFLSRVYYGPPWLDLGKIFKMSVLRRLENAILRLVSANTVSASFNYTFFHLLNKHYVATSSKIT